MTTTEVEEVFTIESGNDLIDVHVIAVKKAVTDALISASVKKDLIDTSFLIFSEGLEYGRRIALVKIGPDNYYALRKDKSVVYKLAGSVFVFPAQDSVDLETGEEQWLLLVLKSDKEFIVKQFNEILSFFANVVTEVPGDVPELDAIKRVNLLPGLGLYPALSTPVVHPDQRSLPPQPKWQRTRHTEFRPPSPSAPVKKISEGLVVGAEYVAMGFNAGTGFAEQLVRQGGEHLVNREMQYTPKRVDPTVIRTLRTVRSGAETCSVVADFAVGKVAEGARCLGQKLVPHVQSYGTDLVQRATGKDTETSGRYVSNILSITGSGIQGFGTICHQMTASARQLSKAVAGETVRYVQRRYGDDAAEATNEALYAAGNAAMAATAVRNLAPKSVIKRAAREAATEGVRTAAAANTAAATPAPTPSPA